jgi:TadE-like protein
MVEFALLSPLVFLLILGLADFARAVYYYNVVSNSAREGAREAILAYNQCQNTAPCSTVPSGSSLVGVEKAVTRSGGGILSYQFNETSTDKSAATACTPAPNHGCVWIFIVGGDKSTSGCTPPNPSSTGGTDDPLAMQPCDFNQSKQGGNRDLVVEIEFNFAPLTPLVANAAGNSTIMWAKSQMRTEY